MEAQVDEFPPLPSGNPPVEDGVESQNRSAEQPVQTGPRLDMLEQQQQHLVDVQQHMADAQRRVEEQQAKLLQDNAQMLALLQQLSQDRRTTAPGAVPVHVPPPQAPFVTPMGQTLQYAPLMPSPVLQMTSPALPFTPDQAELADPETVGLRTQVANLTAQLQGLQGAAPAKPQMNHLDKELFKQLTNMKDYDGKGTQPWLEYQQAFESKASLVPSLPKTEWVRYLHSHVVGAALMHARSVGLVVDGVLQPVSFEEYCAKMNVAMFGEVLTPAGNFMKLCSITQEGNLSDPLAFLREKEKYLNKIPLSSLSPDLRAASCLMGMDSELRLAVQAYIRAQPGVHALGQEFQFPTYEELKGAVLAVHTMQAEMFAQANRLKRGSTQGQHQAFTPVKSPRVGGTSNTFPKPPPQPNSGASTSGGLKARLPKIPWAERKCEHCGGVGHYNKGFPGCPHYQPRQRPPPPPPPAKPSHRA